ncbi:hypothetical protein LINPERHAP1_LOCUS24422 [Linum perenne]
MHEKLLTNKERQRRHLTDNPNCARCGGEESISHVLRECPVAALVWGELKFPPSDINWWEANIQNWLLKLIKHENSLLLGVTYWYLWRARNELIFDNKIQSATSLARRSCTWSAVVTSALNHLGRSGIVGTTKMDVSIARDPGPSGRLVLNMDGSVITPPERLQLVAWSGMSGEDASLPFALMWEIVPLHTLSSAVLLQV